MSVTAGFKRSPDAIFAMEQFEILNREILKAATFLREDVTTFKAVSRSTVTSKSQTRA
jgi:hypothetical protein